MSQLTNAVIYDLMARWYLQYHKGENWSDITHWAQFKKSQVNRQLKSGALKTFEHTYTSTIWVYPTCETWLSKIEPIVKKYSKEGFIPLK